MIHGFNDETKEKVGVVAEQNIITLTNTLTDLIQNTIETAVFDEVDISNYSGYAILESSIKFENAASKTIGGRYVFSNEVYPRLMDLSTSTRLKLSMVVINPSATTQSADCEVKVLLIQ